MGEHVVYTLSVQQIRRRNFVTAFLICRPLFFGISVLAIKPGECVMISGFPKTKEVLKKSGVTVHIFDGDSLCIGCEGGQLA